ncbi:AAA family ATPase [Paraferrimonas sedimenticola]|uniref:ATPase AAA n=1 Tax=Paraferrimonas sedimenticola TaxID=375674 RepID=A0AA37W0Q9_9GAMM|nr:AAA family ATPase [Paraferrimonas sedimenticola]GLP95352.1 ATPase AAA [Paraferrimonas sedimenticola]
MIKPDELVSLMRLVLSGKDADVRLYLAKLVRKLRKEDADLGAKLEDLLKTQPARSNGVLRRNNKEATDSNLFESSEDSSFPLLKRYGDNSFSEKPLMDESLQQALEQVISERRSSQLLLDLELRPSSSLIFQGPPGVGKTMTARWLASKLDVPFYALDLTAVMSSYLGKTGSNLRSVIEFAKSHPCVLLLDEIDAIAKKRSDEADVGEIKRLVTVMLQELEEWPTGGMLIAATNHPELVDPALWRRFDVEITFSNPSEENVSKAVASFLGKDRKYFTAWEKLISLGVKGTSYSNIKRIVYKLRKLRVINPVEFEENIVNHIVPNIDELARSERIELAARSVAEHGLSQQKASKVFGVSRDTIRKRTKAA